MGLCLFLFAERSQNGTAVADDDTDTFICEAAYKKGLKRGFKELIETAQKMRDERQFA